MSLPKNKVFLRIFALAVSPIILNYLNRTGYLSAVVIEASRKFNCTLESFRNKSEADCVIEDLVMTGSIEPVLMYTIAVLILSGFNAVWRTTIPALAGDQVCDSSSASDVV